MSLLIDNGTVFLNGKFVKKDIVIEDGIISQIGTGLKADERIKAFGMLVLPGLIDPHVHLREPGDTYKEDFVSGGKAAIAGGFTTVMDMPNNKFPTITKERLEEKRKLAKKALCDIFFHFGGTNDNFEEVKRANPKSMKLYLGHTTGNMIISEDAMEEHFKQFPHDRPIILHACDHQEDEKIGLKETLSIEKKALDIANIYDRRIHVAHASTKQEVFLAKKYKNCTVEVAPHHLFLSQKDYGRLGPLRKVNPPLRTEQKRLGLWSSLDMVDCIATDHAPHTIEDKEEGAAGFPGLETSLGLMLEGCNRGLIDKIWLTQVMSQNVADIFGLNDRGRIEKGLIGDITIVDPKKEWVVDHCQMYSKCKWSPFDGMRLTGKAKTVIKNGKVVYDDYLFL
ncbi:MAG: dihydroorotase [Candidatus Bilamarchaeum sp.]|jgi:dihydroorotase